jgi:hypothetical protein
MKAISIGSGSKNFFLPETPVSSPVLEVPQPVIKIRIISKNRIDFFIQ